MSSFEDNVLTRDSLVVRMGDTIQPYLFRLVQLLVNGGNAAIYAYVFWVSIQPSSVAPVQPPGQWACMQP
jgi:hypothetical protein